MKKYLLVLIGLIISSFSFAQKPVSRIYSDYAGYWNSSMSATIKPDNSHNLLAFTWDPDGTGPLPEKTFSTGVNNALLTNKGVSYTAGSYIALPVYTIPTPNSETYIGVGQLYGGAGNVSPLPVNNNLVQYLSDGIQGLDLGTALFNITSGSSISLNTLGIVPSSIGDNVPDLIFTQVGTINDTTLPDTFRFVNQSGQTVGTQYVVSFSTVPVIGSACWKFYHANTNPPTYSASTSSSCTRVIRVLAADWSEFGINSTNYSQAVQLIQTFSGSSDLAFIGAYNEQSITFAASFNGSVFNDNNAGTPDGIGYNGISMTLRSNGTFVKNTVTNSNGFYFFDNINTNTFPGPYTIEMTVPAGFSVVGNRVGTTSNIISAVLSTGSSQGNNFGINRPPVAANDTFSAPKNNLKTFNLIANDNDFDGGVLIPASINLIAPTNSINRISSGGNVKGFDISSQGNWKVDDFGILTFTPATNFYNTATTIQYTIKDNAGLISNTANINIDVNYCYKPGAGGNPASYTKLGISTLSERYRNWPEGPDISQGGIPNGFIALNSTDKGMVISRVLNSSVVPDPKKGMIVYDIASQCIKLYNGSVWNCIKRTCNESN
ncbi:Ig-like domain-containing protein [Chryseobacterium fluminis]|uniref:Ig-like domain-containing protein n=1 Tax=Chryseobacterium fluminis TaxID=2983606 RepID=UPI00224DF5A7|nr:Ig-like domain-containing protein [Chryseobacterium sp. MMS21-Ot14]UZT97990.1 Ig-like domain-containing protein [Chryseobacterium sp. MMS21-Ot14]